MKNVVIFNLYNDIQIAYLIRHVRSFPCTPIIIQYPQKNVFTKNVMVFIIFISQGFSISQWFAQKAPLTSKYQDTAPFQIHVMSTHTNEQLSPHSNIQISFLIFFKVNFPGNHLHGLKFLQDFIRHKYPVNPFFVEVFDEYLPNCLYSVIFYSSFLVSNVIVLLCLLFLCCCIKKCQIYVRVPFLIANCVPQVYNTVCDTVRYTLPSFLYEMHLFIDPYLFII